MSFREYVAEKLADHYRFFVVWAVVVVSSFGLGVMLLTPFQTFFLVCASPVSVFAVYAFGTLVSDIRDDVRRGFEKWKIERLTKEKIERLMKEHSS